MSGPITLRDLYSLNAKPAPLHNSVLMLIDCQNTYRQGELQLDGVEDAIHAAAILLARARAVRAPVVHVMHDAGKGTPFDITADTGQISPEVAPRPGELVIVKRYPSAFFATELYKQLRPTMRRDLVLAGFMTHGSVSATAFDAFHLGHQATVVASATAARGLRGTDGSWVDAATLQAASLASIADLFGLVAATTDDIPE